MNLGLLDILTTQQADRPDLKRDVAGSRDLKRDVNEYKEFKEHLESEHKSDKDGFVEDSVTLVANTLEASLSSTNKDIANFGIPLANNTNKSLTDGISVEDLASLVNDIKANNIDFNNLSDDERSILASLLGKIKNISDSTKITNAGLDNLLKGNVLSNLIQLQEEVGLETQILPISDIAQDLGAALSSATSEIAQAGLLSSAKETNVVTNNSSVPTANILQKSNVQQLGNLATTEEGTIAKIADTIIETAKDNAQTPTILHSDVKSGQIESLLANAAKEGQKTKDNSNSFNDIDKVKNQIEKASQNSEQLTQKLQSQIDNNNIAANKATQGQSGQSTNPLLDSFINSESNSTPFKHNSDLLNQASLSSNLNAQPTTGDFTKFQKYVDTVSNNIKNMGAMKAGKSEDVLAQIKFGISSLNGNRDSKITIQLHPKELGSVDVRMELGNDGKTKVAIMAEKIDTLNLLQKESASLKGLLQDALQAQSSDLSFSFHEKSDEKWKEIINEAFGSGYAQNEENDDDGINNAMAAYSSNMALKDGLDIRV